MTIVLITHTPHFIGLAADTKPTGVAAGSTFWEYDTDTKYITYNGTDWTLE